MSEAHDLGDLIVAYTDYNRLRWNKELPPLQQHAIVSYFSNLQYLTRNTAAIEREPAKLDAFKKTLDATVKHQVTEAEPSRAEVSGFIGALGIAGGIAAGIATAYQFIANNTIPVDYGTGSLLCAGIGAYLANRAYRACKVQQHARNYHALKQQGPQLWSAAFSARTQQISEALGRFAEQNLALRAQGPRPAA